MNAWTELHAASRRRDSHSPSKEIKVFTNFEDGFEYCREVKRPVVVWVNDELVKLYPSGTCKEVGRP